MLENRMIVPFVYQTKPSNSLFEELKFISETYSFINGFIFILFVKLFRNTLTYVKRPFKTSYRHTNVIFNETKVKCKLRLKIMNHIRVILKIHEVMLYDFLRG